MPIAPLTSARARRVGALAAAGVLALVLAGCTGAPTPTPSPTPSEVSAEPIFASDEEALAAAVAAYETYLALSAEIAAAGGAEAERIDVAVTPGYSEKVMGDFKGMAEQGLRIEGSNTLDTTSLIEHVESDRKALISIYGCVGVGTTRILNESGDDLTPQDRAQRVPLVISFETAEEDQVTRVAGSELWTGDDFC